MLNSCPRVRSRQVGSHFLAPMYASLSLRGWQPQDRQPKWVTFEYEHGIKSENDTECAFLQRPPRRVPIFIYCLTNPHSLRTHTLYSNGNLKMHFSTALVPLLLLARYGVALPALEVRQATVRTVSKLSRSFPLTLVATDHKPGNMPNPRYAH